MESSGTAISSDDRTPVAAALRAQNRSRVTNGQRLLEGMDKRSAEGRRFRDLVHAYSEPFGGFHALDAGGQALVRESAAKTIESERNAAALARGEAVDSEQSVRIANSLARMISRLDKRRAALEPPAPRGAKPSRTASRRRPKPGSLAAHFAKPPGVSP